MTLPILSRPVTKQVSVLSLPSLREAVQTAAELVCMDSVYLPIFERLERDLHARESKTSSIDRALSLAEKGQQLDNRIDNISATV